jgi:hypothetical protein
LIAASPRTLFLKKWVVFAFPTLKRWAKIRCAYGARGGRGSARDAQGEKGRDQSSGVRDQKDRSWLPSAGYNTGDGGAR